jgi:hypothetical protein
MSESVDVFSQIVNLCDELVNVVLDFPISARQRHEIDANNAAQSAGRFVDLLQWLHYEEWLAEQVKLYEAKHVLLKSAPAGAPPHDAAADAADAADTDNGGVRAREAQLFSDIVQLQEETFARASQLHANRHLVKRILEAKTVHELAFRPLDDGAGAFYPQTELDYAAVLLRESLPKQRELVELTAALRDVDAKIALVEKKNAEWRRQNSRIVEQNMQHVFGGKSAADHARPANYKSKLAAVNQQVDNCIVLRNVLKQLVFESGLNWSSEQQLREAVLAPDEKREI